MPAINLDNLVTNLGAYYRQANDRIFSDALLGLDPIFQNMGISLEDGIADEEPLMNASMGNILQPGGDPTLTNFIDNAMSFDNRTMKVRPVKADLMIYPQHWERMWQTQFRRKNGTMKELADIPFYQFIMDKIIAKMQEELYFATFIAKRANATTTYTSIVDGLIKLLKDDIAAAIPKVSQVGSGNAIVQNNVVAELEIISNGVTDANAAKTTYMYVSPTVAKWYVRSDPSVLGRNGVGFDAIDYTKNSLGMPTFMLRGCNTVVVPTPALSQSVTGLNAEATIVSVGENIIVGTDSTSEKNNMDFQKFNRGIKVFVDFKWGVQYGLANTDKKPIFVNAGPNW